MTKVDHTITELYENEPESLIDILIPFLKNKVSIKKETREPHLSSKLLQESAQTKVLYYLLGKKTVALSFPDSDSEQYGVSATGLVTLLYITKNQSDTAFYRLKKEKVIEPLKQDGEKSRKVFYHIPNHKVLEVIAILETKTNRYMEEHEHITKEEFNNLKQRVESLEKKSMKPITSKKNNTDWDTYLEQKKPKNDYERIALIVDHLTRNNKGGVTKEEIITFIRENPSGFENTKKIKQVITITKTNKAYGYIEYADEKVKGEKRYILSIHGSQHIEEMPTDKSGK